MSKRKQYIIDNGLKRTRTSIYIIPMLGYTHEFFPKEFIETYIIAEKDNNKIVCTFENSNSEDLKGTLWQIQSHELFENIDYADNNSEVVVTFRIPAHREIDFNLFLIGRYTKFSNEYKEILLDYHGRKTGAGKCLKMIDVLFPDHAAKKWRADKMSAMYPGSTPVSINDLPFGEVESIPNLDTEQYINTDILTEEHEAK